MRRIICLGFLLAMFLGVLAHEAYAVRPPREVTDPHPIGNAGDDDAPDVTQRETTSTDSKLAVAGSIAFAPSRNPVAPPKPPGIIWQMRSLVRVLLASPVRIKAPAP
jgi:hypothetical protein